MVLPHAASILFQGGFPRLGTLASRKAAQRAIFAVQREVEGLGLESGGAAVVISDGSTVDGLAHWAGSEPDFWTAVHSTRQAEHQRYHAVIHLRSPGHPACALGRGAPPHASPEGRLVLDDRVVQAWEDHPNLHVVESNPDFLKVLDQVLALVQEVLPDCCRTAVRRGLAGG
jgi:hypothetical protein